MRLTIAIILLSILAAGAALGAESAGFPAERLQFAIDRNGIIDVESGDAGVPKSLDLAVALGYAHNPLVLYTEDADGERERVGVLVGHRMGLSLVGAVTVMDRVQVGLELPFTLYQGRGEGVGADLARLDSLGAAGAGDVRVIPKIQIVSALRFGIDVALLPVFTIPSGFPRDSYFGDEGVTVTPMLAASRGVGPVRLALNTGYRWRKTTEMLDLDIGPEILFRLGAAYSLASLSDRPLEIGASVSGATAAKRPFADLNSSPIEFLAAVSYEMLAGVQLFGGGGTGLVPGWGAPDFRVLVGVRYSPRASDRDQDRLLDENDKCPDEAEDHDGFEDHDGCPDLDNDKDGVRDSDDECPNAAEDTDGFQDLDGCPDPDNDKDGVNDSEDRCPLVAEDDDNFEDDDGCPDQDNDKDGVEDRKDRCENEPEDRDQFQDDDGCPDEDNDKDGFADGQDKCPNEAEVINGKDDNDGCPDVGESKVEMTGTKINIREKVFFDTNRAAISAKSHDLLRQVAAILRANPQVTKLRIEGHTDDRGGDKVNLDLSQRRAEAVRAFLIEQGIAEGRLIAAGFGQTRPIASNKRESGRELNRRVEFVIIEVDGKPMTAE